MLFRLLAYGMKSQIYVFCLLHSAQSSCTELSAHSKSEKTDLNAFPTQGLYTKSSPSCTSSRKKHALRKFISHKTSELFLLCQWLPIALFDLSLREPRVFVGYVGVAQLHFIPLLLFYDHPNS